jgi:acyl transferase domain-containing protein/acyl carrier protein
MDYAKFSELYEQVQARLLTPDGAAVALNGALSSAGVATTPVAPRKVEHFRYDEPCLRDHLVDGHQVLTGVTYASLALDWFFAAHSEAQGIHLHDLEFVHPVMVAPGESAAIHIETVQAGALTTFEVLRDDGPAAPRDIVATGRMQAADFVAQRRDLAELKAPLTEYHRFEEIYPTQGVLVLGASFKSLARLYVGGNRVLAQIVLSPEAQADTHGYGLHPLLINSAFLCLKPLIAEHHPQDLFLPFGIRNIRGLRPSGLQSCWLLIDLVKKTDELVLFDFDLIDDASTVVARFKGCALKRRRSGSAGKVQQATAVSGPLVQADALYGGIQRYLAEKIAGAGGYAAADLDLRRNIMDMGLDSAQVVEIGAAIQRDFGIELYPTLFFEYTNIKELTDYFFTDHRDAFSSLAESPADMDGAGPAEVSGDAVGPSAQPASWDHLDPVGTGAYAPAAVREPIAIIGMQGQHAGSADLEEFWTHLCNRTELMREVPLDHWDSGPWFDEDASAVDKTYCKWGSFIDGVDKFDAPFFNVSRREAEWLDPQVRMLLQSVYATAEDAGYAGRLRGTRTGVFVGACFHDYQHKIDELRLPVNPHVGVNNTHTAMANRISYHFDLTGPSVTVDTACSSSLVALHQACQALHSGECDSAFVCGANLLLSSMHYRVFSSLRALSPTGRCHTFDASADGYVPGECVASVLLKPLSQAVRDGDRIEAVIRGSAALHGGYTPSLTAPSVAGEQNVILKAWDAAQIDPATISYVEAHGTGTRLGDPIEINALKNAFAARTDKQGFCSIGSVKANIGHTEGAAGLSGVLKVILQMKHRRIPPLMGFTKLNPYIKLEKSALRLEPDGAAWDSPPGVPRRAGISSFGVTGAYAHVVLEEYLDDTPAAATPFGPSAIVLSAKNEQALKAQAARLLQLIQQGRLADGDLPDVAYTLQLGRPAMESRLALLAGSVDALRDALSGYLRGQQIVGLYQGRSKRSGESPGVMLPQDIDRMTSAWIKQGDYERLLELWVGGPSVNWHELHAGRKRRFISLPTYPFSLERYWVPEAVGVTASTCLPAGTRLHPLLHENASDLHTQSYRTRLDGTEFFLADHRVGGAKVLPGVVHLEMARAAAAHACGRSIAAATPLSLTNVVWVRPITIGTQAEDIHIEVRSESAELLSYDIFSRAGNTDERTLYSHGQVRLNVEAGVQRLDLAALRQQCDQRVVSAEECYELIAGLGLELGDSLRGVEAIHVGPSGLLVALRLPESLVPSANQFTLHPTLLDAALQSCACLQVDGDRKLALPYSLGEIEILAPCSTPRMWAFTRLAARAVAGPVLQVNIDLSDEQGTVCARVKNLAFRVLRDAGSLLPGSNSPGFQTPARDTVSTVLAVREWTEALSRTGQPLLRIEEHLILFCDVDDILVDGILSLRKPDRHVRLHCKGTELPDRFDSLTEQAFAQIQAVCCKPSVGPVLLQIVLADGAQHEFQLALAALLKTAQAENSKLIGQVIDLGSETDPGVLTARIWENASTFDQQISYLNGKRRILASRELQAATRAGTMPWRDDGVYLITGGAGGLGLALSREIVSRVRRPRLVLTGRSELDAGRQARLDELRALGARVTYLQVDVTDRSAVTRLVNGIVAEQGSLNGIVHCAGVLRDEPIQTRSARELTRVTAPKVRGVVYLDEASKNLPLDVFLTFSSIAGVFGNAGQADYAAGNAFMDGYAQRRHEMSRANLRAGRTLSIDWPVWQYGGMRPSDAMQRWLSDTFGLVPIENSAAFDALYRGLSEDAPQLVVLSGRPDQIRIKVLQPRLQGVALQRPAAIVSPQSSEGPAVGDADGEALLEKTLSLLVQRAAEVLKMRAQDIDARAELDSYGFNSVALTEYVNLINREFKLDLSPTVFYEHTTLWNFARHLLNRHTAAFATKPPMPPAQPPALDRHPAVLRTVDSPPLAAVARNTECAVAIVGISGCFPMARNLSEFWQNLVEGRDCIGEIPADRWDWRAIYGDPQKGVNKSNVKWGGFIDGIAEFDPLFFGISPREAVSMDPQQRLLMTHVWLAIEDAGYSAQSLSGTNTGVFVGTTATGYSELLHQSETSVEAYTATGLVPSIGPNRMSYFLNLCGPSEPVETACSSALVAVHRGVQAIRSGECGLALVGGVNTILNPALHVSFNKAGMLSLDGRCKAFSAGADGFSRGEGAGIMLLKELSAAEQSGDHIYAVIRGTAQNHGGRAKSLTAPNPKAQADLLKRAYTDAGINPDTVGYVETHGTGTALGDPIEVEGLKLAFRELADADSAGGDAGSCGLGSVKSNIGHLELAAGIAGIFKVVLQLQHKTLVKSLHCDSINPYIRLDDSPFYLVQENRPWQARRDRDGMALPRRAGVSSFGFGGTNCHVVIEEYVPQRPAPEFAAGGRERPQVVLLSAKNSDRLRDRARQLQEHLRRAPAAAYSLEQVAYTLQVGREPMEARLALSAVSLDEVAEKLQRYLDGAEVEDLFVGQVTRGNELVASFSGDEALQKVTTQWLAQGKSAKLMRLWVQGLAIDWSLLYGEGIPGRIALPTYPFSRDRFWTAKTRVDGTSAGSSPDVLPSDEAPMEAASRCLEKVWRPCDEPQTLRAVSGLRTIAILANASTRGLAEALLSQLERAEILDAAEIQRRLDLPKETWKRFDGCIDLFGCSAEGHADGGEVSWRLLQQMIEHGDKEQLTLFCVTSGLETHRNDEMNLSGAVSAGLYRMLQYEYSHVRSRHVDLQPGPDDGALARQIAREYRLDIRDAEVCYRDGQRLTASLTDNARWRKAGETAPFPAAGVLWITGGTRGLGYRAAEHLVANHGVRRLVLTGRENIPPRDQWVAHQSENTPLGKKVRAFQDLERQGVELMVLCVDLADEAAVRSCVKHIKATLGDIVGVLHCAGTISTQNAAFVRKLPSEIRGVLHPKVAGLTTLFECVSDEPLQFFVTFSSVSALVPRLAVGLSDYAMANAYMDYFAQSKHPQHPIVSIQWPRWSESGMRGPTGKNYDDTGLLSLTDDEGLQFLDLILRNRIGAVVMPARIDPQVWDRATLPSSTLLARDPVQPRASEPAQAASAVVGDSRHAIASAEQWLTQFFSEELKIPIGSLSADVPFQNYGMESVMLAQVVGRMERELKGLTLDPSKILENATIGLLAAHLISEHPQAVAMFAGKPPGSDAADPATGAETLRAGKPPDTEQTVQPLALPSVTSTAVRKVAIVGMSAHLPDAPDVGAFWQNLVAKRDSIKEVPPSRWDTSLHYSSQKGDSGKSISKWGAFLECIEDFDPGFFKISESLAMQLDPLERQWLEVSAEALADAGYDRGQLWGKKVGVFAGARTSNYRDKLTAIDKDVVVGLGQNFIAAHLAHIYNFKGPNMVVDAACASSLTAIHLAVESIKRGESDVALAGGVEVLLDEAPYIVLSTAQVLSPQGRSKTFDESADGIGLGEGCAVLVLKLLDRAIADGDKIYGVVDGSAINNDGHTMGITTPNPAAQSELIEAAIASGDIDRSTISYVETHGTGTLIGDPIELNALARVFSAGADKRQPCGVSSAKSNIGHLLSAAGAAGIVKVLLSIVHRKLAPSIHCDKPNRRFNFAQSSLYVVSSAQDWHGDGSVLRAGVSSFGLGGNNAHIIISDEGIPAHLRASLEPRGTKVSFSRRRFWPLPEADERRHDEGPSRTRVRERPMAAWKEPAPEPPEQGLDMLAFFDVRDGVQERPPGRAGRV